MEEKRSIPVSVVETDSLKGIKWLIQSLRKIVSKIRAKFQEKCPVLYHRSGLMKQNMATAAVNQ